jgi:hypothetical protein
MNVTLLGYCTVCLVIVICGYSGKNSLSYVNTVQPCLDIMLGRALADCSVNPTEH